MKIAVLSDIHSNSVALQVCIDFLESRDIDGVIFLGDNVSDCPDPQTTISLIQSIDNKYKTWHINGNREEYFIHYADGMEKWNYSSNKGSLLYTYENLTKKDIDYFRSCDNQMVVEIEGTAPIRIVHGSPGDTRELLYAFKDNTNSYLSNIKEEYLLCGHSHRQFTYTYNGRLLLNPGSVGVAKDVKKCAQFAILTWGENTKKWEYELIGLPFDFEKLQNIFYHSDLMKKAYMWPRCILRSMETGINYAPVCAKAAYDLAIEQKEKTEWLCMSEKYWDEAAKKLKII